MQDRDTSSEEDRASEVDALGKQRWLTAAAVVGGTIGLLTALVGVAQPRLGDAGMSPTAVAMVNGEAVREESLMRALTMLATDRRAPAEPIARREVLARLIEEELLVQRALELGLVRSDASVRRALVRAMIDAIVLEASSVQIDEARLRQFFEQNRERFARPATVDAERVLLRSRGQGDDVEARASAVVKLLRAGADADYVRGAHGDEALVPMPAGPLVLAELREYVGPAIAQRLSESRNGDVVGPMDDGNGSLVVLRVRAVEAALVPEFSTNRELVEAVYRKERTDGAMRAYLSRLRDRAAIVIVGDSVAGADS
jgi:hypothetical protein